MIGLSAVARAGVRCVMSRGPWLGVTPGRFVVVLHAQDYDAIVRFQFFTRARAQSRLYAAPKLLTCIITRICMDFCGFILRIRCERTKSMFMFTNSAVLTLNFRTRLQIRATESPVGYMAQMGPCSKEN